MLEIGQVLAARYMLLRRLGEGRNGEVWLARGQIDGRERALKFLSAAQRADRRARRAFVDGAGLQRGIDHANVLRCHDVHDTDDAVFAVLDYCASGDLGRIRGRPWQELLPLLTGIAVGATEIHAHGIVHRDLKPSNVLLDDAVTPRIADFGIAARAGEKSARAGSPFNTSPQQLDGDPVSSADDIYAFGALAYELLTGYPPLYPDAAPERIRTERPAPISGREAVPAALERLVLRCLEKDPAARPHSMSDVRSELRAVATESVAARTAPPRPELRPPAASSAVIQPQWRRTHETTVDAGKLRSEGFKRGLLIASLASLAVAVLIVFVALPRWVQQREPAPAAAPTAAQKPSSPATPAPAPDLEKLAELERQFEQERPGAADRLKKLETQRAAEWGGDTFAKGRQSLADADAAFGKREFESALTGLRGAVTALAATEKLAPDRLRAAVTAGTAALDSGNAAEAQRQFELALAIDPTHAVAKRGLARARTLDEVRRLVMQGSGFERDGQAASALEAYRHALQLDPDTVAARDGAARLQAAAAGSAFSAAMSQGFAALARHDYAAARSAFARADQIKPGTAEVQDALAQVAHAAGGEAISGFLDGARAAEAAERWTGAVDQYRKALQADGNLLAAQEGLARSEPRALLDAELQSYLDRPERLFSSDVRAAARNTVQRASSTPNPGPRLANQLDTVTKLISAAETPVRVALSSDNQTEVTIYRVGKLGAFATRDMELMPGRYTVVGTRSGFRDVRRELTVLPGQAPPAVVIRCEDPI